MAATHPSLPFPTPFPSLRQAITPSGVTHLSPFRPLRPSSTRCCHQHPMLPSAPDVAVSTRYYYRHQIVIAVPDSHNRHLTCRIGLLPPSPEVSHRCCCLPRTSSSADITPSVRPPPYYHTGTFPGSVFLTRACSQSGCCARHLHCTAVCTTQPEPPLRRADLHSVAGMLTATHRIVAIRQKSPASMSIWTSGPPPADLVSQGSRIPSITAII